MCDAMAMRHISIAIHLFFIYSEPNPEFPTGLTFFAQSGFHLFVQQQVSRKIRILLRYKEGSRYKRRAGLGRKYKGEVIIKLLQ